ncbi:MAG: type II toxin-antitoxin system HigB family toxin [Lentisphaerae bacterium]|nr:type II toxin-antitoxin system HigB family toxin [Lentisphaerota bacterium]
MRVIARKTLSDYWTTQPTTEQELKAWFKEAEHATWQTPADVKAKYGNASILKKGRVVFNICGNKYRLVVWINYSFQILYIRFVGTHEEYDNIDAQVI